MESAPTVDNFVILKNIIEKHLSFIISKPEKPEMFKTRFITNFLLNGIRGSRDPVVNRV